MGTLFAFYILFIFVHRNPYTSQDTVNVVLQYLDDTLTTNKVHRSCHIAVPTHTHHLTDSMPTFILPYVTCETVVRVSTQINATWRNYWMHHQLRVLILQNTERWRKVCNRTLAMMFKLLAAQTHLRIIRKMRACESWEFLRTKMKNIKNNFNQKSS